MHTAAEARDASSPPNPSNPDPAARPWARLLELVDAPARQAFLLGRRPWAATGVLLAGLAGVLAVTASGAALSPDLATREASQALLRAALQSLAMILPSAMIFGAYARLSLSPAAWWGATAVAFGTAAVVLITSAPLMVYLALVARAAPWVTPSLLLSAVALVSVGATLGRVLKAADPGPRGEWAARLLGLALGVAFFTQSLTDPAVQAVLPSFGA